MICQVCGDNARGLNFEVMTCMSCKTFFRRHALKPKVIYSDEYFRLYENDFLLQTFQCPMNSNCEINQLTRSGCLACRLKKCFTLGMNPQLIRAPMGRTPARSTSKLLPFLPKVLTCSSSLLLIPSSFF